MARRLTALKPLTLSSEKTAHDGLLQPSPYDAHSDLSAAHHVNAEA